MNAVTVSSIEEGRMYEMVAKKDDSQDMAKVSPDIEWSGLNMTAQNGSKKILRDCWGTVSSFSLLSVLHHLTCSCVYR